MRPSEGVQSQPAAEQFIPGQVARFLFLFVFVLVLVFVSEFDGGKVADDEDDRLARRAFA